MHRGVLCGEKSLAIFTHNMILKGLNGSAAFILPRITIQFSSPSMGEERKGEGDKRTIRKSLIYDFDFPGDIFSPN